MKIDVKHTWHVEFMTGRPATFRIVRLHESFSRLGFDVNMMPMYLMEVNTVKLSVSHERESAITFWLANAPADMDFNITKVS